MSASTVMFLGANMPLSRMVDIRQKTVAEGKTPVFYPTLEALVDAVKRQFVDAKDDNMWLIVRNPATSVDGRKWGEYYRGVEKAVSEVLTWTGEGSYCVMEFWCTDKIDEAKAAVEPAPVYELVDGYEVPLDGVIPNEALQRVNQ